MANIYLSSYTKRMYEKKAKMACWIGMVVILLLSSLFHFAFELFGKYKILAVIFAVNESVWEHLKIGFFAGFIFYIIEFFIYGKEFDNFFAAKATALFLIPFLTATFFYTYTAFLEDNLILDISTLVLAIIIAQLVSLRMTLSSKRYKKAPFVFLIILLLIIFPLFTYIPPKIPQLFYDFYHKRYGI